MAITAAKNCASMGMPKKVIISEVKIHFLFGIILSFLPE
ncbi:hypothetical protein AKN40_0334 [Escherichia coli]|nr:hypothetical protein AKN40_0334 [Escherichia coli]EMU74311.1 hypothetical protein ECMP0210179_3922 [Escherichia coli MP021017.9]EMU78768.1 hypothetical protein ECMP0210175_3896 [Escherichia coli MP021017.5]EMU89733.1 hypothetical protein ECMP0210174_3846 [Escherichia coli MP021017.4]EMU93615.1 hypothetical protein ECMP0210172_3949 [Escherichia coli MP021017.2]EMV04397.1 hypothetical protein ECMP02101710_3983 [Escherichia coli MP021017.10]EMV15511.1 hypothetical protein ECMP02101712_3642 [E